MSSYLDQVNNIEQYINTHHISTISNIKLNENLLELRKIIKEMQTLSLKAAHVSNSISDILRIKTGKNTLSENTLDVYPHIEDISILEQKYMEIVPIFETSDHTIPVKIVQSESEIPSSYLYYIKDIDKFCININGINLKGNLGNIFKKEQYKTTICQKINCNNSTCSYSHAHIDHDERNFTIGSWIYGNTKAPYYTRQIGGKNTLNKDLLKLDKDSFQTECYTREAQIMHDLLIYTLLHNENYIKKYNRWDKLI